MGTNGAISTAVDNGFDDHHEIFQLVNEDGNAQGLLNVFFARQCSNPNNASHWIANITFVSGSLEATMFGIDASGLRQLASSMNIYAKLLQEEDQT